MSGVTRQGGYRATRGSLLPQGTADQRHVHPATGADPQTGALAPATDPIRSLMHETRGHHRRGGKEVRQIAVRKAAGDKHRRFAAAGLQDDIFLGTDLWGWSRCRGSGRRRAVRTAYPWPPGTKRPIQAVSRASGSSLASPEARHQVCNR